MRIIAGSHGGRLFNSPHGHRTHPMSDKIRGALFNMLGDISGLTLLDPFAGSGALSFEAISRGAGHSTAIDNDRSAQRAITENIDDLDLGEKVQLIRASARSWLAKNNTLFDIVLLDPPYDRLHMLLLNRLATRVKPGGRLVLSWPGRESPPVFKNLRLQTSKQYGDASLHIYISAL